MRYSGLVGFTGGMERVAEAQHAAGADFFGDHTGNASAHGFAADHKMLGTAEAPDDVLPGLHEDAWPIRSLPGARDTPRRHVRKFEARNPQAEIDQPFGKRIHEGTVHRLASAVRQYHVARMFSVAVEFEV